LGSSDPDEEVYSVRLSNQDKEEVKNIEEEEKSHSSDDNQI